MTPPHDQPSQQNYLHVEEVIGILRETLEYLGPVRADAPESHAAWSLRKRVEDALDALRPPTPLPPGFVRMHSATATQTALLHDETGAE